MSFAEDTALEPLDDRRHRGRIVGGWDIAGNANGGYLLAIAARAALRTTGRADPISVTGHYLAPGRPGPVEAEVTTHKQGRAFGTATTTLRDGERTLLVVLGAYGDLSAGDGPARVDAAPPELPPPERCVKVEPTDGFPPPFMGRVDLRVHPDDLGFATGVKSGVARVRGWFRLAGGEALDTLALLVAVDAFPPTVFNTDLPVAWTPTVELTAHVRARPAPGAWVRCVFTTRFITGGFLEEDGEVWDESGRLIAQSRQLALVPRG